MNSMKEYRPVSSVALARNETEKSLKNLILRHQIPSRKLGNILYVDVHKLDQYLAEVERKPKPTPDMTFRRDSNGRYR